MTVMNQEKVTPFYKEPLVILLIAIPFAAVIWGGVMLTLAFSSKDSLVSDSYYKQGVSYTENKELDQNARVYDLKADIEFKESEIMLTLQGKLENEPASLQLKLIHPTLEEQDITIFMQRLADGLYGGVNETPINEKRHVWLSSPEQHWRIRTTDIVSSTKALHLSAR